MTQVLMSDCHRLFEASKQKLRDHIRAAEAERNLGLNEAIKREYALFVTLVERLLVQTCIAPKEKLNMLASMRYDIDVKVTQLGMLKYSTDTVTFPREWLEEK